MISEGLSYGKLNSTICGERFISNRADVAEGIRRGSGESHTCGTQHNLFPVDIPESVEQLKWFCAELIFREKHVLFDAEWILAKHFKTTSAPWKQSN